MDSEHATSTASVDRVVIRCCCKHTDARACFLARHPECRRFTDDLGTLYDSTMDYECECCCHREDDDYGDEF